MSLIRFDVLIRVEKEVGKQPLEGFIYSYLTNCGDSFEDKNPPSFDEVHSKYTFVFEEVVKHWYHVCQTDVSIEFLVLVSCQGRTDLCFGLSP
jgi:hypothetical protein